MLMKVQRIPRRAVLWNALAMGVAAMLCAQSIGQARPIDHKTTVREGDGDYVVLVHGLSWFRDTLKPAEKQLNALGYHTVHVHYASRKADIGEIVDERVRDAITEHCTDPNRKIHFVGHSMGGIMIRKYLKSYETLNLGKVVLMATPNQGTELAEILKRSITPIRKVFGKAVEELGTTSNSLPNTLGAPNFEPGIIMGSLSAFPFLSPFVPGTDDGVVAVEAGKVERMRDFIVTPTNHCNIAREEEVLRQIAFFFVHGTFDELPAKWREACSRNAPALGRKLIARPERRFRFRSGKGAR